MGGWRETDGTRSSCVPVKESALGVSQGNTSSVGICFSASSRRARAEGGHRRVSGVWCRSGGVVRVDCCFYVPSRDGAVCFCYRPRGPNHAMHPRVYRLTVISGPEPLTGRVPLGDHLSLLRIITCVDDQIGKSYAGRASGSPCLDLLMTLLSMGEEGWRRLLRDREALVEPFR